MRKSTEEMRQQRKLRIRKKISGTPERPRLVVFRSNKHLYAQLVNDVTGQTIASSSTLALSKGDTQLKCDRASAAVVGKEIAEKAKAQNIEAVVFDRNGYKYHGRIQALADGAREGGLKF